MMANGMDPGQMTPAGRLGEVGMLPSLAMMRPWLKRRAGGGGISSKEFSQVGEDYLELPTRTSPDGTVDLRKESFEWEREQEWNRRS